MVEGLDSSFDALLMIGYHSHAGSNANPLAHTMTGGIIHIKINQRYASEFVMAAYTAGLAGVPVVFVSGDAGLCEDAAALIPALTSVAVKRGIGSSTVNLHPQRAIEQIRAGVERALKGDLTRCRVPLPARFDVEIRYKDHFKAYASSFFPGARLADPYTVQFTSDDYFEVLRLFAFVL
jgi:D-amino peptidase